MKKERGKRPLPKYFFSNVFLGTKNEKIFKQYKEKISQSFKNALIEGMTNRGHSVYNVSYICSQAGFKESKEKKKS